MKENTVDFSALAQVLDSSFGRSSTPHAANFSVKFKFAGGETLVATYTSVLNFGLENEAIVAKRREADNAGVIIKKYVEVAKKQYKEATGKTLKLKDAGDPVDSLDIVGHNGHHNPKRTARFHRVVVMEIG